MRSIAHPPFGVRQVIAACTIDDETQSLYDITGALADRESAYHEALTGAEIWQFPTSVEYINTEQEASVHEAYITRLRRKTADARTLYDFLRIQAPDGTCPNCMAREVGALDHYLPRAKYPSLALQPSNLVPICNTCNQTKSDTVAAYAEEQFLHSYFDDLGAEPWLVADVLERPGAPLAFRVERPTGWSDLLFSRVAHHFDRYELAELYGAKAGVLLGNHRMALESHLLDSEGEKPALVIAREVSRLARSHSSNQALWQAAAFAAWSKSPWFCEGGWRTVNDSAIAAALARVQKLEERMTVAADEGEQVA